MHAAIAAVIAEAAGLQLGILIAGRLTHWKLAVPGATLFDRTKLMHMLSVNRDIMIRTTSLIRCELRHSRVPDAVRREVPRPRAGPPCRNEWTPAQQRTACGLRCVRGTPAEIE